MDGTAEPLPQVPEQLLLVVADPRHVAVRSQQERGHLELSARVDHTVDPLSPAVDREPAGLIEQQAAAAVQQLIEPTSSQLQVPHPPTEQLMAPAEVVAHIDRADLLGEVPADVLEAHQFRDQPA